MMFGLMQVITAIKAEVCRKATIPASTFHRFTTITLMGHETFHFNRELQQCGSQGFPVFVEPFLAHFVGAGGGSGHHIIFGIWRVTITQSARIFLFFTLFHIFHTTMLLFFQRQSRRKLDGGFPGFIWSVYHFKGGKSFPLTRPKKHSHQNPIWRLLWAI